MTIFRTLNVKQTCYSFLFFFPSKNVWKEKGENQNFNHFFVVTKYSPYFFKTRDACKSRGKLGMIFVGDKHRAQGK